MGLVICPCEESTAVHAELTLLALLLLPSAGVVVTCSTDNPSGFQSGTYDITLAAYLLEQGAVSVCKQELESQPVTTRISVKPQPVVGLRQLEPKPVCLGAKSAMAQFEYWVDNVGSTAQVSALKPLGEIVAPGSLAALSTECTSEIEGGVTGLAQILRCRLAAAYSIKRIILLQCLCQQAHK
jgi:hypothetical protein